MKATIASLILVFASAQALSGPITADTGPGGVETSNGAASALKLWFRADSLAALSDGAAVASWPNRATFTGAGTAAAQGTASRQPTFQSATGDLINGQGVVRFDGSDDYLNGTVTVGGPKTFFMVARSTGSSNAVGAGIGTRTSGSSNWNSIGLGGSASNVVLFADRSGAGLSGLTNVLNQWVVGASTYATTGTALFLNGVLDRSNTTNYTSTGSSYQLGTRNNELSRYLKGDMAEAICYDRLLNSAERQLVENYLSARYGIALAAGDRYAGDQGTQGDYDLDVFGIARINSAEQVASAGSAGLGIEAGGAGLTDGQSVLAGHKTPANAFVADVAGGNPADRWARVWYLDQEGSPDIRLTFDAGDAGLAEFDPELPYDLLYSPTNDFQWQALGLAPEIADDRVTFDVGGNLIQDGYYTLAAVQPQVVPEPASLVLLGMAAASLRGYARRRRGR